MEITVADEFFRKWRDRIKEGLGTEYRQKYEYLRGKFNAAIRLLYGRLEMADYHLHDDELI
jgi:hypothetical protein